MKTNSKGVNLIKSFEGLKLKPYICPAGVLTVGYGHTKNVKAGQTITEEKAEELLEQDLEEFEKAVLKHVTVKLNENQFAALVSFVFNLGAGNFKKSTLLKRVNEGKHSEAAFEFSRWNRAGGKVLPGLSRRREMEARLYNEPI